MLGVFERRAELHFLPGDVRYSFASALETLREERGIIVMTTHTTRVVTLPSRHAGCMPHVGSSARRLVA